MKKPKVYSEADKKRTYVWNILNNRGDYTQFKITHDEYSRKLIIGDFELVMYYTPFYTSYVLLYKGEEIDNLCNMFIDKILPQVEKYLLLKKKQLELEALDMMFTIQIILPKGGE